MKTLKYIMTVITIVALTEVAHAQYASDPTYNFQSPSTMENSGSSLPSAAETGVVYAEDIYSNATGSRCIRRISGLDDDSEETGGGIGNPGTMPETPIGGGLGVLLLLAIGYGARIKEKVKK